ncbi:helix-turn-helix domain-containing protein [Hymenobacter sp. 15J16-1T3B]|nr:helix-turn-helix domain-containing protein [Hymenobacter sp. 15J16-1T3B]
MLSLPQLHELLSMLLDEKLQPLLAAVHLSATQGGSEYLTTRQALAFVHLSKPTLNKLRREGRITAYHSSDKRVLYRRSELVAYLEASKPKEGRQPC